MKYISTLISSDIAPTRRETLAIHTSDIHFANDVLSVVSTYQYHDRTVLTFSVSQVFQKHFAFIRGLFEFSRSREFLITFDKIYKNITIDFNTVHLHGVTGLVSLVSKQLHAELSFRSTLQQVLALDKRYREESSTLITANYLQCHMHQCMAI
jgi:hypothetical protein